jgi:hypothetical protein
MKISTLQNSFNHEFPFLRLEFFRHGHSLYGGNSKTDLLNREKIAGSTLRSTGKKEILITEDHTVAAVEQMFSENFGLAVQVFRKSGKSWLETTRTDDWTLRKQNDQGLELSQYTS